MNEYLSGIFGGWPNALQGSASAIISGVVAAGTAFLVVHLTARADRKRALENEGRQIAVDLVRTLEHSFIGIPDRRSLREDFETAGLLNLKLRSAAAMLARHNFALAQEIQNQADCLATKATRWTADGAPIARYNEMYESVEDLHELTINWLGDVVAVRRDVDHPEHKTTLGDGDTSRSDHPG